MAWLKRGEVSAAITASATPPQGCNSTPLGSMRYLATASPVFVQKHFVPAVDKSSLSRAPMLVFNSKDRLQDIWMKQYFEVIHSTAQHFIPSTQAFVEAQVRGMGWGVNPEQIIQSELASGQLVTLLPSADLQVPLYWQCSRLMEQALAGVTRSIKAVSGTYLHRIPAV